jgi:hypothetical protein
VVLLFAIACSDEIVDYGDDAAAVSVCPATITGWRFESANACFDPSQSLAGICTLMGSPDTKGVEAVCAVDANHDLFVIVVSTSVSLSGTGWAFGPRAFPNQVTDSATVSGADATACDHASAAFGAAIAPPSSAMCAADAGAD